MKYVIDSSVAFKWFVDETNTDKALVIHDDLLGGIIELLAPDVFPVEMIHAVTRAERQGRLSPVEGRQILMDLLNTLPTLFTTLPDLLTEAYGISSKMRIGVYDCLYVALADQENCEFITADDRLVRNLQPTFPFIVSLASLP